MQVNPKTRNVVSPQTSEKYPEKSMATLFELAITAEKVAQDFYLGLVKKFSHLPEISDFWKGMQKDEIQHAQELEKIRDSLAPKQLLVPADSSVLRKAEKVLKFSVKDNLNSIRTLNDAYELAHELEYSEVQTVFAFLTTKFIPSDKRKKFVLSEIEDHLTKLMEFSQICNAEWRKGVVIKKLIDPRRTKTLSEIPKYRLILLLPSA